MSSLTTSSSRHLVISKSPTLASLSMDTGLTTRRTITNNGTAYSAIWIYILKAMCKMLKKKNTFNDFIDVAEFLVKTGYTSADRLVANGLSAGGLLMGVVTNTRPDLGDNRKVQM